MSQTNAARNRVARNKRSTPWIHRWSRPIMAGVATVGAVVTAYMTYTKLTGSKTACPIEGCNIVLSSPYANAFGLPLALFGLLAYLAMIGFAVAPMLLNGSEQKRRREEVERWTGYFLFWGGTAMVVFSAYLLLLLALAIKAVCIYCLISAFCSATLFVLSIIGREWEEVGELIFGGLIAFTVMGVASLGLFATSNPQFAKVNSASEAAAQVNVETTSGESEIALAKHLKETGAKFYGAFWCPHCQKQKQVFGKEAMEFVPYVECSEPDRRPTVACQVADIKGYPTWDINGQRSTGEKNLAELADLSGYQGPRDFKYQLPPQ
ncbi:MAG: vitamin K epoxide reductase family protein [Elainella sp.]